MESKDSRDVPDSKGEEKNSPPRKGRRERQDDEPNNVITESVNNQNSSMDTFNPANKPRRKPGTEGNSNNTQDSNNNWMDMTMDSSNSKVSTKAKKTEDEPTAVT